MEEKRYDALVIGAGNGGLTAALRLAKSNKKVLLAACDVYRPAAIDQLDQIAKQINVPLINMGTNVNPVDIALKAKEEAYNDHYDVLIIDTAGRLQIDETLMTELKNIKGKVNPDEILLLTDAMAGQDSVNVAKKFNEDLKLTGAIMSKMDGDSRGGAALSIAHVTGVPIKFIGTGEKLSDLIKEVANLEGDFRVRVGMMHPRNLLRDLDGTIDAFKHPKVFNFIHLPVQSGSDKILKLMNRKYTKEEFKKHIETIRKIRPNISITTDVIVGFPTEDEKDFKESLEFIKEINFSKVHVFPYSKRDGTKAARMQGQINGTIKKERVKQLLKLSSELEQKYYKDNIGKKEKVLIEKKEKGYSYGHTSNYLYLKLKGNYKKNNIYDIIITEDMFIDEKEKTTI